MNGEQDSAAAASSQASQRQVRVQLTSKQEDIALPENTGPILVPTGETAHELIMCNKSGSSTLCLLSRSQVYGDMRSRR